MASIRLFGRGKAGSAAKAAAPRAGGGGAVDADLIATALADLSTAALSATWRCRHSAGLSIGEGAVDFGAHRSRATVIRGKATYEYVRDGASVYRAVVPEEGAAAAAAGPDAADEDEAGEGEEELGAALEQDELDGLELEGEEGDGDGDGIEAARESGEDEDAEPELAAKDAADGEGGDAGESSGDEGDGEGGGEDAGADRLEASGADDGAEEDADTEEGGGEPQGSDTSEEGGEDGADEFGADADAEKDRDARAWQTFSEHDACGPHAYAEPAVLAQAVRRAGVVQPRKAEEFDGVMLAAFSVTAKPKPADPDKLLARLARQLRDHGANTVVVTAFVDESAPLSAGASDADAEAEGEGAETVESSGPGSATGAGSNGVAGAPRIVRLRVELPHWTPADDPTADHTVSVDLFELGDPVEIEIPDRDSTSRRTSRTCADLGLF
ncbi:MAG TPA: hypothetical protein VFU73_02000 [Actinocrinis sp.]|nr:hypothetical protein [Actinocrinis sp.]